MKGPLYVSLPHLQQTHCEATENILLKAGKLGVKTAGGWFKVHQYNTFSSPERISTQLLYKYSHQPAQHTPVCKHNFSIDANVLLSQDSVSLPLSLCLFLSLFPLVSPYINMHITDAAPIALPWEMIIHLANVLLWLMCCCEWLPVITNIYMSQRELYFVWPPAPSTVTHNDITEASSAADTV